MYKSLIQALTSQRGTVRPSEGCDSLPPLHGPSLGQPVPKPGPPAPQPEALHPQLVPPLRGGTSERLGKYWGRAGQVSTGPEGLQWL